MMIPPDWLRETEKELSPELTKQLLATVRRAIPFVIAAVLFFGFMMWDEAPRWRIALWCGLVVVVELAQGYVLMDYREHQAEEDEALQYYLEARPWLLLASCVWGALLWAMLPEREGPYRVLALMWLVGFSSLATLIIAPRKDMHLPCLLGFWLYPIYRLGTEGGALYAELMLGAALYLMVQWEFVNAFHRLLQEAMQLRQSNASRLSDVRRLHAQSLERGAQLQEQRELLQQTLNKARHLAQTDALTGCYNQRALREQISRCLERGRLAGQVWSLAIMDLDLFKRVNDEFGHQTGDELLCQVVQLLAESLPSGLLLARYGGEEFAVLAPGYDGMDLLRLMEGMRARMSTHGFEALPIGRQQTVSIGVTGGVADDTVHSCLQRADAALYRAKHQGRNRVCLSDMILSLPEG